MSEEVTLSVWVAQKADAWSKMVGNKTIADLGGTDAALVTVINEITLNIWPAIYSVALAIEDMVHVHNNHVTDSNTNFDTIVQVINDLTKNIEQRDAALAESVNKSLQILNKQMTNQNKVLDKQVIKLSKSISKITGE